MEDLILSKRGCEEIQQILKALKEERADTVEMLQDARELGDLSENAEYDAAKKKLREIDYDIRKYENALKDATVVEHVLGIKDEVVLLANVTLKYLHNNKEITYKLVCEIEADIRKNKISVNSPLGNALINKKKGDIIKYEAPIGMLEAKITDINYD